MLENSFKFELHTEHVLGHMEVYTTHIRVLTLYTRMMTFPCATGSTEFVLANHPNNSENTFGKNFAEDFHCKIYCKLPESHLRCNAGKMLIPQHYSIHF